MKFHSRFELFKILEKILQHSKKGAIKYAALCCSNFLARMNRSISIEMVADLTSQDKYSLTQNVLEFIRDNRENFQVIYGSIQRLINQSIHFDDYTFLNAMAYYGKIDICIYQRSKDANFPRNQHIEIKSQFRPVKTKLDLIQIENTYTKLEMIRFEIVEDEPMDIDEDEPMDKD
ncbi:hypothetical protein BpHYR1_045728 [Brachionus plicatilis]|uniref:Uncharacterized protein n=1 Tax=Brachionus plicatilis TaxID=10195 RepID=A0A3M7PWN5_BRAPC|nr:hypothetical protein BpHYR1_045728 [Brachionus plicatilis]